MQNKIHILFLFLIALIIACNENAMDIKQDDNCYKPTIKDPNDVKPMARMMRTMADYCDSMRLKINNNITVDSIEYPLMPFWTAEPTDSSVLETLFFNNAAQFEAAYRKLMQDSQHQKENYTAVINTCIQCHSSYCSGPLRRIKKLPLNYHE